MGTVTRGGGESGFARRRESPHAVAFPFVAVTGLELAKQALLLLAVDPALKGVLIASPPGWGKSLLARSFQALVPELPWVELPLGATEDRLLGGLDFQRTLSTGKPQTTRGILGSAHRGIVHVDGVNLLDGRLARHLASALNRGFVDLEREGISDRLASDFGLVGTYNPEEGAVAAALADSVAIHVLDPGELSGEERLEMLGRVAAFDRDPVGFARWHAGATRLLRRRIEEARSRLVSVDASAGDRRRLSQAALDLGVEGSRADIFALAVARAHAAFMERSWVVDEDIRAAVRLVLLPRAVAAGVTPIPAPQPDTAEGEDGGPSPPMPRGASEDLVLPAFDCPAPKNALRLPPRSGPANNRQPGRGSHSSPRREWNRGRFQRAVEAREGANKVALAATLRAAAPSQKLRQAAHGSPAIQIAESDLRFKQFRHNASIRIVFAVDASGSMAMNRIQQAKGAVIRLLDQAQRDRDEVALIGFRGSHAEVLMPPSRSVERARQALDSLPVGGGTPLAAGLEEALRLARCVPASGPRDTLLVLLTDGKANVPRQPQEGVERQETIWREIEQVCAALTGEGVVSVVIDTTQREVSDGEAARLAILLNGRAVHLPRPDPDSVYQTIAAAAATVRRAGKYA